MVEDLEVAKGSVVVEDVVAAMVAAGSVGSVWFCIRCHPL